ncbi:MAG: hypothetical protein JWQ57_478 [Mucilaginibacter sp.]|nr:hypothetical protein [Mucilaginibacter sp.]
MTKGCDLVLHKLAIGRYEAPLAQVLSGEMRGW